MNRIGRVLAGTAAVAAIAGTLIIPASTAGASAPGTPQAGALNLSPVNATNVATPFTLGLTIPNNVCPRSTAAGNQNWQAFIAPTSIDPVTLTWASGAPTNPAVSPLYSALDTTPIVDFFTNTVGGFTGITSYSLAQNFADGKIPAGTYNMGYACTVGGVISDFSSTTFNPANAGKSATWTVPVTINAAGLYSFGAAPAKPALTATSYDAATTTATVNFTPPTPTPTPVLQDYTATLVPVGTAAAISPITVSAAATSFSVPGVALGSSYTVTLRARNATGLSVASDPLTITGAVNSASPVVTAPDAFEGLPPTVTWVAPTSPTTPAPASYTVAISGGPSGFTPPAPFTGVTGLSQALPTTLPIGSYTATVTPFYAAGSGVTGVAGSDPFSITPNSLIYQEITVERPPGALVLTQRCGVYGPLDPFTAVDAFPGFPRSLLLAGAVANTPGTPEAPDTNLGAGYTADPNFTNYPEAGTYPTECGLSMGVARLVTSGTLAGQFYTASGRLNQVTVLDTRDVDAGWTAKGDIDDLFQNGSGGTGRQFDGNYLGWAPQVTDDSDPVGGSTYNQTVTAGGPVLPGTGGTGVGASTTLGLRANPTLASAPLGAGLGIATLDARMNLLIPASVDRGVTGLYTATLSLTVA